VGSEYFLTCRCNGLIIFVRRKVLQKHNKNGFNGNLSVLNDIILQRSLRIRYSEFFEHIAVFPKGLTSSFFNFCFSKTICSA
jgi:hypothetical protein